MKKLAHDLFLLMLQLSELSNPDRILRLFLESINSLWEELSFEFLEEGQNWNGEIVEISTPHHSFGRIAIAYNTGKVSPDIRSIYRNAIHMLALILENLQHRNQLSSDKLKLEEMVAQRTADLKEREEQYRALVENFEDIIIRYGRDCKPLYVNPSIQRITSFTPAQCIGKSHRELGFSKSTCLFWERNIRKVFETGKPVHTQFTLEIHNESTVYDWRLFPEFDNRREIKTVLSASRDITNLRRTELALKESELKYRYLIENLNEGIWVIDPDACTTFVNSRMAKMLGYSVEEMMGQYLFSFLDEEGKALCQNHLARRQRGIKEEHEFVFIRKNGEKMFARLQAAPLLDSDGNYLGSIAGIEDITEPKRAEIENKKLEAQFRQAQKMEAIGQLAGGVAHDFNNLLMVINGYTDMAMSALPSTNNPILAQLEQVREATHRATTLVRQLLTFSRREAIQNQYLNLNDLIGGIIKMLRRVIGEHIELIFNPDLDVKNIYGDPGQIEQILMNLCINARDAMPNGGTIRIDTQYVPIEKVIQQSQNFTDYKEFIMLAVSDTGIGIPPEILERIFEPFFTTKEEGKGTGLGLATVYGIVARHDGILDVESELGQGTTFTIYFPVSRKVAEDIAQERIQPQIRKGQGTLFIAEDEEAVRKLIIRILEKNGYTVITAKNGQEAIESIERYADEIQLALLDVVMPRKSGKDVAEYCLKNHPQIPLILMSGYDFNLLKTMINSQERKTILHKPFTPTELLQSIQKNLKKKSPSKS